MTLNCRAGACLLLYNVCGRQCPGQGGVQVLSGALPSDGTPGTVSQMALLGLGEAVPALSQTLEASRVRACLPGTTRSPGPGGGFLVPQHTQHSAWWLT